MSTIVILFYQRNRYFLHTQLFSRKLLIGIYNFSSIETIDQPYEFLKALFISLSTVYTFFDHYLRDITEHRLKSVYNGGVGH